MSNRRHLRSVPDQPSVPILTTPQSPARPGESEVPEKSSHGPGEINAYVCNRCYKLLVVRHIDAGSTPMYMPCLVTEDCEGTARSMRYPPDPPEKVINAVRYEWYRPTWEELAELELETRQRVLHGGLMLRETS